MVVVVPVARDVTLDDTADVADVVVVPVVVSAVAATTFPPFLVNPSLPFVLDATLCVAALTAAVAAVLNVVLELTVAPRCVLEAPEPRPGFPFDVTFPFDIDDVVVVVVAGATDAKGITGVVTVIGPWVWVTEISRVTPLISLAVNLTIAPLVAIFNKLLTS